MQTTNFTNYNQNNLSFRRVEEEFFFAQKTNEKLNWQTIQFLRSFHVSTRDRDCEKKKRINEIWNDDDWL